MPDSKDVIITEPGEIPEIKKGLFPYLVTSVRKFTQKILNPKRTQDVVENIPSSLFRLDGIDDVYIVEKMLSMMSDKEIIGSSDIKSLIKYFHPDIPNTQNESFSIEVRRLIFLRLNAIRENGANNPRENTDQKNGKEGNTYQYKGRTCYTRSRYFHENEEVSSLMTHALNDIFDYGNTAEELIQKVSSYLDELNTIVGTDVTQEKKYLLKNASDALERILFTINMIDFSYVYIPTEALLDTIMTIENTHGIPCKRMKRNIIIYYSNYGLSKFYHTGKLRTQVNIFANKYGVQVGDIGKLISRAGRGFSNLGRGTGLNSKNPRDKNIAPRVYKK